MTSQTHPHPHPPWHALTWAVWALAGAVAIQLAPSPLYVVLVVTLAWLVVSVSDLDGPFARAFPVLVGFALAFTVLRVLVTAATTHGGRDVLVTTPSFTLPDVLGGFTVGGPIGAPIVARAASEGLVIVGIVAVFAAFNAVVSHYELVSMTPRAFHEIGLVVVVALAFVPSTITAVHDVGEADRARTGGRVVRRGRLVRRLVPVLESGLERAVTLAESLDSRGFARDGATARQHGAGWCGITALVLAGGAFVALVGRESTLAIGLGVAAAVSLVIAIRLGTTGRGRVRYRPRPVTARDYGCMAAVLACPAILALLALTGDDTLSWTASPLRWPGINPLALAGLTPLLAPLLPHLFGHSPVPEPRPVTKYAEGVPT
jgi:energy-coupling factor transporter transmembrane protein EcfT